MDAAALVFVILTPFAMLYVLYDALRDRGVL
jgi:hypothetical protein